MTTDWALSLSLGLLIPACIVLLLLLSNMRSQRNNWRDAWYQLERANEEVCAQRNHLMRERDDLLDRLGRIQVLTKR